MNRDRKEEGGVPCATSDRPFPVSQLPPSTNGFPSTGLVAQPGLHPTIATLTHELRRILARGRIPGASREAADIIAVVLDVPRLWANANNDAIVPANAASRAHRVAHARASGVPFAYAVGRAAFRHLTLEVDDRVLIPRQETEVLVESVLKRSVTDGGIAIDVGTGSGAIALALASEGRFERVIGTDISSGALAVAQANALRLSGSLVAAVEFIMGAFLAPVANVRARVVVSNPPYIASHEAPALPASVRDWEPPIALFGGPDGMAVTARIIRSAVHVLESGGLLAVEIDSRRASLAARIAADTSHYRDIAILPDLTGRDRILLATRTDR